MLLYWPFLILIKKIFILETDASGVGLGAILAQEQQDGTVRPIAYGS